MSAYAHGLNKGSKKRTKDMEKEIEKLTKEGLSSRKIGKIIGIGYNSVLNHLRSIRTLLLVLFFTVIASSCTEKRKVIKIIDGDTVVLDNDDHIRIYQIDSPELTQPFGIEAKHFTDSVLRGKEVTVIYSGQSSYNRKVAAIEIGGVNFAEIIVSYGLAHVSAKYCHNEDLIHEYEKAKDERLGLFSTAYELPYNFRHRKN